MKLRRARVELDYDDISVVCDHHPDYTGTYITTRPEEQTIFILNGKEYLADIDIEVHGDTYIVKFTKK